MKSILRKLLEEKETENSNYCLTELMGKEDELLKVVKKMDVSSLYKSAIHGIYHSEKVLLFAFILSLKENLEESDKKILLDAAMYHDIGREGDANDSFHGRSGALKIESVIDKKQYNSTELKLLKAIIDAHSRNDRSMEESFFDYDLNLEQDPNISKRYVKLASILKDVDALDRYRFGEYCDSKLNPSFLRTESSKELKEYADKINEIYRELCRMKYNGSMKRGSFCFHSIGFDFFKLDSILEHGILSVDEMKQRGIPICKNFDGGNQYQWISVVDTAKIEDAIKESRKNKKCHSGYVEFTKHGISFLCYVPHLMEPLPKCEKDEALLLGLPYDKGHYLDERYVYQQIPSKNLFRLELPKQYANTKINQLSYLYGRLSLVQIKNKINYFNEKLVEQGISLPEEKLEKLLLEYKKALETMPDKRYLTEKLLMAIENLNSIIQDGMYQYFNKLLNKDEITVQDVVEYILKKKYDNIYSKENTNNIRYDISKRWEPIQDKCSNKAPKILSYKINCKQKEN